MSQCCNNTWHWQGFSKHAAGNYLVYPDGERPWPFADQIRGSGNSYLNNTVVSLTGQFYGGCGAYSTTDRDAHCVMDNNTFYSPKKLFNNGGCGTGTSKSFGQWQKSGIGQDQHSSMRDLNQLDDQAVLRAGRKLLSMLDAGEDS